MSDPAPTLPPRDQRPTWREAIREPDAFGFVLLLIVVSVLVMATGSDTWVRFIGVGVLSGTLLFLLWTTRASGRMFKATVAFIGLSMVVGVVAAISDAERLEDLVALCIAGLLAFVAPIVIARALVAHPVVTFRTILGALCLYLLIGVFFSVVFQILNHVDPPFFAQTDHPTPAEFMYFSYVTLATLGYGDFTPLQSFGQMVSVMCALIGQLYLVSVVALLVANVGKTRRPIVRDEVEHPAEEDDGSPAP